MITNTKLFGSLELKKGSRTMRDTHISFRLFFPRFYEFEGITFVP